MSADALPSAAIADDLPALSTWIVHLFGARASLAFSLANEDMVLLHALGVAAREVARELRPRVFVLDTGRLPDKSYRFLDSVREHLPTLHIDVFAPNADDLQRLYSAQGAYGFRASLAARQACCHARKVAPLARALDGQRAWVTGLRRAQSPTRSAIEIASVDDNGRVKLAPLAKWSAEDVLDYLQRHGVPRHPLYAEGYTSIGCDPCTRAIQPGEPERAGRWWWESADSKECGLHSQKS